MGHPNRIREDGGADCDLNHRDAAQEVSERKNMWPTNHSCDILGKTIPAFCPFPKKIYLRLNWRVFWLMAVEETSK